MKTPMTKIGTPNRDRALSRNDEDQQAHFIEINKKAAAAEVSENLSGIHAMFKSEVAKDEHIEIIEEEAKVQ